MKPSKIYDPFDVVIVPFPYTDNIERSKRRPAVVLSSRTFNQANGRSVCAMITSGSRPWLYDVPLADLKAAGLHTPCAVRVKLFTLENVLVLRQAGRLAVKDAKAVTRSLREALPVV